MTDGTSRKHEATNASASQATRTPVAQQRRNNDEDCGKKSEAVPLRIDSPLPAECEAIVERTMGCLIQVHRHLGPGLSEHVYTLATSVELDAAGILHERERPLPIYYRDRLLCQHRVDVLVDRQLVLEIKCVERIIQSTSRSWSAIFDLAMRDLGWWSISTSKS
jgi:GxxExxY protein